MKETCCWTAGWLWIMELPVVMWSAHLSTTLRVAGKHMQWQVGSRISGLMHGTSAQCFKSTDVWALSIWIWIKPVESLLTKAHFVLMALADVFPTCRDQGRSLGIFGLQPLPTFRPKESRFTGLASLHSFLFIGGFHKPKCERRRPVS